MIRHSVFLLLALISHITAYRLENKSRSYEDTVADTFTIITSCRRRLEEPGMYRILDAPIESWRFCALNIIAPYDKKVQITLVNGAENSGCQADQSLLLLINGWMTSGSNVWPSSEHSSVRQCYTPSSTPTAITFSQNNAQIVYRLSTGEFVDIQVEFVDNEHPCTVMLSRQDVGKPITLHKESEVSKRCEVYVPGETELTIERSVTRKKGVNENRVGFLSGNDNNAASMATVTPGDDESTVLLACTFARAIVDMAPGSQSVTLKYEYADDRRNDLVAAYARQCLSAEDMQQLRAELSFVKRNPMDLFYNDYPTEDKFYY